MPVFLGLFLCSKQYLIWAIPPVLLLAGSPMRVGRLVRILLIALVSGCVVSLPLIWETPLRTGNLRDPNGPQVTFASESFIDELAVAAHADPVAFRRSLLSKDARALKVLNVAAEESGWATPAGPDRGRGIAIVRAFSGIVGAGSLPSR